VNVSTASRVLDGQPGQRASEKTRRRIIEAAHALDYHPHALARGLRTSRTHTIGIVVPQLDNPVFGAAIRGAEIAAGLRGYSLLISHREAGRRVDGIYRRLAGTHRVDGLLVASLDSDRDLIEELGATGIPFVLMNRAVAGAPYAVALDNESAARMAMDHLLDLGHRRIAHLAGRLEGFNGAARLAGYRAALLARGHPPDERLVVSAGYTPDGGAIATRALLAQPGPRPTAIFAATLISAAGALGVLHAAGVSVPGQMSVIALHDAPVAEMVYPALTTVRTPTQRMGGMAAETLIGLILGEAPCAAPLLAPEGIVHRASTAPLAT